MIEFDLLRDSGILVVKLTGTLGGDDFRAIASTVDPYISENGKLAGLLIEASSFPGWKSFDAVTEHIKFVRDHQRKIDRVAAVTDSTILAIAPRIAELIAHPEFKVFKSGDRANALAWLRHA